MNVRILVIEDQPGDFELIRRSLRNLADTRNAPTLADARAVLADASWQPDAILLDVSLPDGSGARGSSLSFVPELSRTAPVIVCTGLTLTDCPELSVQARAAGAAGFTSKHLILHEPADLIRQIDWAITPPLHTTMPAPGMRQSALRQRAIESMQRRYDPNDMGAMVATMLERQDAMHAANEAAAAVDIAAVAENAKKLDAILEQVKKTNGRVTTLENWREGQGEALKVAAKVGGILLTAVLFLFGSQLKDRLMMDTAAVKKIVEEYMTAVQGQKPSPPVAP